ncbi:MAG TPA: isocitrate lyase/phosphoenolpyruvate mutase family protein [Blastocatellia bacterium]|jgi:2-methylisocitrate lyase-like PEP mutase family enzyme|nr:isocitrate lyase/phosphoenolpyruvate mutase family protein [Blastocatellia bacterium]
MAEPDVPASVIESFKMNERSQKEKAEALLSIHRDGGLLVLPNIWDPIGARILEAKGYPAVATASAAVSASLGYQDGEKINRSTLIDLLGRIARSVNVPVTADIEAGYGESLAELELTAREVIEAGVVGVNIEDSLENGAGLRAIDEQRRRISTLRQIADSQGVHLIINARVDSFVTPSFGNGRQAMEEAVMRARAYAEAGADCIYPIGPGDEATVRMLRDRIESPINILASPTAAPLSVLREIGINRVSFGPFVFRSCLRKFVDIVEGLNADGDYASLGNPMSREEVAEYLRTGHE